MVAPVMTGSLSSRLSIPPRRENVLLMVQLADRSKMFQDGAAMVVSGT